MSLLSQQTERHRPGLTPALARSLAPVLVAGAIAALAHALVGPVCGDFAVNVLCKACVFVMLAASLNLVNGFTGQFSIGHAGFLAVGAYSAGVCSYYGSLLWLGSAARGEAPAWATITLLAGEHPWAFTLPGTTPGEWLMIGGCLVGALLAGGLGLVVGLPSLRLRGDYLAIVTLGFGEIVRVLFTRTPDVISDPDEARGAGFFTLVRSVGGALGFGGIPWSASVFWTVLACGWVLIVCSRVKYSSTGRAMLSVREDEVAAGAMGVHVTRVKVLAFVLSSALAGLAGGLFAHLPGNSVVPGEMNFMLSFDILIMVVLGGLGSISGCALAAVMLTLLAELLRDPAIVLAGWAWVLALAGGLAGVALVQRARGRAHRPWMLGAVLALGLVATALGALGANAGLVRLTGDASANVGQYRMILYALGLIGIMLVRPAGLMGTGEVWELFKADKADNETPGARA